MGKQYLDYDGLVEYTSHIKTKTMPTASADYLGEIIQYVGNDTNDFKNGFFYKCVASETTPVTYSWESIGNNIFIGTEEQWDALTQSEQNKYDLIAIEGDEEVVNLGVYLAKVNILPTANVENVNKFYLLTATQAGYNKGSIYQCQLQSNNTYAWVEVNGNITQLSGLQDVQLTNLTDGQVLVWDATNNEWVNKQALLQYSTMPTASASLEGRVVQFVGETTADFIYGEIYKCVSDGEVSPSYSWIVWDDTKIVFEHELRDVSYYNAALNNSNLYIYRNIFVPKGKKGLLKVIGGSVNSSYDVYLLRKNYAENYTIIDTISHTNTSANEESTFDIFNNNYDVYIGLYSASGGVRFRALAGSVFSEYVSYTALTNFDNAERTSDVNSGGNIPFAIELSIEVENKKGNVHFPYVVDLNGTGDFLSIREAIVNTQYGDTIYILNGIYQESVDMSRTNRHLIGQTKDGTIIGCPNIDYAHPAINIQEGILENLTIIAGYGNAQPSTPKALAYAIHSDLSIEYEHELIISDCNIISNVAPALGLGVRHNQKIYLRDCFIETKVAEFWNYGLQTMTSGALYFHNDAEDVGDNGFISIERCVLKGVKSALLLSSLNNGNLLTARFLNNTLWATQSDSYFPIDYTRMPTEGHLAGEDIVLDPISNGNNVFLLNATGELPKVNSLPTPSAAYLGQTYLLTADQTGYQKGGIYQCVSDGAASPTYSWQLISATDMVEFTQQELEAMW